MRRRLRPAYPVLVATALSVACVPTNSDRPKDPSDEPPTATATKEDDGSAWDRIAPPPVAIAQGRGARSGDELLFTGWDGQRTKVVAYAPSRSAWRELPTLPADEGIVEVLAMGDDVALWNFDAGRGWVLDEDEGTWQQLPDGDLRVTTSRAVWSGDELLVWGRVVAEDHRMALAAYDPTRDRWREAARSPATDLIGTPVWADDVLVVSAMCDDALCLLRYDPVRDRWTDVELPGGAFTEGVFGMFAITPFRTPARVGRSLYFVGPEGGINDVIDCRTPPSEPPVVGYELDLDDWSWRVLDDVPQILYQHGTSQLAAVGELIVAWSEPECRDGATAAVFDTSTRSWSRLTPPPVAWDAFGTLVAFDEAVMVCCSPKQNPDVIGSGAMIEVDDLGK